MQGQRRQSQLGLAGGNGLVQQLERVRNDDMLRRAVDKAKPTVASRPAAVGSQLPPIGRSSASVQHAQREVMVQAAMADRMMLLNIAREMSRPASLTTLDRKGPSSLNLDRRRRELRRIDSENDKMLRRLEGVKSSYNKKDQSRSYMQSRKHAAIASSNRELHANLPRYEKRPASHDPRRADRHQEFRDFDMIDEMEYDTRMDEHPIGDPDHLPSLPSAARDKPPLWQAKQLAPPSVQHGIAALSPGVSSRQNKSARPQSPAVHSRAESAASPSSSRAHSSRPNSVRGGDHPDSGRENASAATDNAPEPLLAQVASDDVSQVESPVGAYKWAKAVEARLSASPPATSADPLAVASELPGSAAAAAASPRSHSATASEAPSPVGSPLGFQEMMLASRAAEASPPAEPQGLAGSEAQHSPQSSPTGSAAQVTPSVEPGNCSPKAAASIEHAAAEHSTKDEDAIKRIESANSYEEDFDDYDDDDFDDEDDAEESGDDDGSVGSRDDRPGSEADDHEAEGSQSGRPASASSRGSAKMSAGNAGSDEGESAAASSEPALSPRSEASSVDVPCDEGHEVLSMHSDDE